LTYTLNHLGQSGKAERLTQESYEILQEIGDQPSIAGACCLLAYTFWQQGKFEEAYALYQQGIAIWDGLGMHRHIPRNLQALGFIAMHLGWYEQALTQGQRCLAFARKIGDWGIGYSLSLLADVALVKGTYTEAQRLYQESLAAHRQARRRNAEAFALVGLAYAARGLGQLAQARQHLWQSLLRYPKVTAFASLMSALPAMALLLVDRDEVERAVELYALASRYPVVANSRWFEDVAGKHIAAAAGALPPDVVAAAQERGRARDLDATVKELLTELEV
jgi:tetratricopeptide (TPR) repeat protein